LDRAIALLLTFLTLIAVPCLSGAKGITLVKLGVKGAPKGVIPVLYRVVYRGEVIGMGISTLPVAINVSAANYTEPLEVRIIVPAYYSTLGALYRLIGDFFVDLKVNSTSAPVNYNFTYVSSPKPAARPSPSAPISPGGYCPACRARG